MKRQFKNYFLISLVAHGVLFFTLFLVAKFKPFVKKENPVEVTLLNSEQLKKLLTPPETKADKIVETDSNTANLQKDENTKLLSEKNNTVKKQTIAKFGIQFKNSQSRGQAKSNPSAAKAVDTKKNTPPQLFNQAFDPYAALTKKNMQKELKTFSAGENTVAQGEASTSNDRVDDVTSDLVTLLNTREYKYYGFYHRIKTQLNQWWQPKVREKVARMVRQGRTIASDTSKETRLMIVLNDKGTIVKIQVLNPSGVRDLDDAAVEAFRAAAPFPNPPKGIVDSDGTVKIPWNFVIES